MKLSNKQKTIIYKSLKLNEDFFDDFNNNDLIDEPDDDLIDDPDYTYNIQFIIYIYPFMKSINNVNNFGYYFEDPKYKSVIESGFLSMKKMLNYILQASPIVTDYSEPKFCSSNEKIIKTFPFMDNKQSNEFEIKVKHYHFITLETSINLFRRKNVHNLTKLFHSFWILQRIYRNLLATNMFVKDIMSAPYISMGAYRNNPYEKSNLSQLMPPTIGPNLDALKLINFLNSKDETE